MYLTYPEYLSYGGTLDEAAFNLYVKAAEYQINYWTFNRLKKMKKVPEAVQRCIIVLIQLAVLRNKALSPGGSNDGSSFNVTGITSQSNDGVSISYNGMSADVLFANCKQEASKVIREYLDDVKDDLGRKVLYRGLYPDE